MSTTPIWTIEGIRAALQAKKISARELAGEFYARIDRRNAELNAYLTLSPERAYAQADRVDAAIARGENCRRWRVFPSPSRMSSARAASAPPARQKFLKTMCLPTTRQPSSGWKRRAPFSLARPTATNSRWAARMKTPPTGRCVILSRPIAFPEARAADRRRLWPRAWPWQVSEPIPAARFASLARSAGFPDLCRRMAASPATA